MSEDAPAAPAGWYPDPRGGQRFWDGASWANLPAPDPDSDPASETADPRRSPRPSRNPLRLLAVISAATLGIGAGAFGVWALVEGSTIRHAASVLQDETASIRVTIEEYESE